MWYLLSNSSLINRISFCSASKSRIELSRNFLVPSDSILMLSGYVTSSTICAVLISKRRFFFVVAMSWALTSSEKVACSMDSTRLSVMSVTEKSWIAKSKSYSVSSISCLKPLSLLICSANASRELPSNCLVWKPLVTSVARLSTIL